MNAVDIKVDRVARFAREHDLAGIVIGRHSNFAWLTDGQSNRIDGSIERGLAGSRCRVGGRATLSRGTARVERVRSRRRSQQRGVRRRCPSNCHARCRRRAPRHIPPSRTDAIGYQSRDWIAHPQSRDRVCDRQAFAWNPSITGTKVEDTVLLIDGRIELITATGEWPDVLEI